MALGGNQTCNINALPSFESLGIASDINVGMVSWDNQTVDAMERCCGRNSVNLVHDCVLWCEVPDNLPDSTSFNICLRRTWNESGIFGYHKASAATSVPGPSFAGLGVLVLVVGYLCHAI
ncbi:hypothetical protein F5Y04DRAFT_182956 [Hypomontagnella monticulosa]|nr:hypothetical protein F5Y04DRAFT_182956 [Hypomontagnella monticulosa]